MSTLLILFDMHRGCLANRLDPDVHRVDRYHTYEYILP